MTWTYTSPTTSTRDEVRFLIGDTSSTDPQLSNEEIDYTLAEQTTARMAAVMCCEALIAKYSRLVSQSVGSISISYGERIEHYKTLITQLKQGSLFVLPYAGGITTADKDTVDEDETLTRTQFKVGQFDRVS